VASPELAAANSCLKAVFQDAIAEPGSGLLQRSFDHHFSELGAQRRARLALQTSAALGLHFHDANRIAATVELLHNASLVQDDFQDRSNFRRGQAAVWTEFGDAAAIGLANCLISATFLSVSQISRPHCLPQLIAVVNAAITETTQGQITDLASPSISPPSIDAILTSAANKSGPLFSLALTLPLILAGQADAVPMARAAARDLGIGYQIVDDLADVESDRESGLGLNLILALRQTAAPAAALNQGADLAARHLREAIAQAARLPGRSGDGMIALADRLLARVESPHG
jgi:geranylgeranyl diphosphate synthase type II